MTNSEREKIYKNLDNILHFASNPEKFLTQGYEVISQLTDYILILLAEAERKAKLDTAIKIIEDMDTHIYDWAKTVKFIKNIITDNTEATIKTREA